MSPLRCLLMIISTLGISNISIAQTAAETVFDRADKNGDGVITSAEIDMPLVFRRADANGNGTVTREEFMQHAERVRKARDTQREDQYQVRRNISYARIDDVDPNLLSLDVYWPRQTCATPHPVMMYIHGGGWSGGDKSNNPRTKADWFTSHGFVFVSANYRLSPAATHPAHIEDVASAIAWTRNHVDAFCGNPDRIFVMGHSAGAHLAALVGTDERRLAAHGLKPSDLAGIISLDTAALDLVNSSPSTARGRRMKESAFGPMNTWNDVSPMAFVDAPDELPPFLMFSTGSTSRQQQNEAFVEAVRSRGGQAEHIHADDRTHMEINQMLGTPEDPYTRELMAFLEPPKPLSGRKIVFICGDEEYRSEESMPMLAEIIHRDFGGDITVCHALAEDGTIDPNRLDHIEGLDAVKDADLVVMYTRFRALPDDQLKIITDFAASGKPMVGFRTSTHAFRYPGDNPHAKTMNNEWPIQVFGQKWITHHGHHGDNEQRLTDVTISKEQKTHPTLRGVEPFKAYSWLYHVDGGGDRLPPEAQVLTMGHSLISGYEKSGRTDRFPLDQPVSWVMERDEAGLPGRVFFSTTAHPYDFREPSMRRHAIQGILWAMGQEELIPEAGVKTDIIGVYEPRPSGFGDVFKAGVRPQPIGSNN